MPAKNLRRVAEGGTYCHVYNKGIDDKVIFADEDDYTVFLSFLEDYLSASTTTDSKKTEFTIKGRSYRGLPHQPKNYHNKIELISYSLMPNHFHLLLHQIKGNSLQAFIRSLCTRYSIYFNKKYSRTGTLFDGPYKSVQVKEQRDLYNITQYLNNEGNYTTQPEYANLRKTEWVKTNIVLSGTSSIDPTNAFGKDYEPENESEMLEALGIEKTHHKLARRDLTDHTLKPHARIPELLFACLLLLILLGIGLRNIKAFEQNVTTLGVKNTSVDQSNK